MIHDVRIVRLNAKHSRDGTSPWTGDSIGWYDGDTLVVGAPKNQVEPNVSPAGGRCAMPFPKYVHSVVSSSDDAAWPVEAQGLNQ